MAELALSPQPSSTHLHIWDLGESVSYADGTKAMQSASENLGQNQKATLILLEHVPVITLTEQHGEKSLLQTPLAIRERGIQVERANRGGDATFHGPGQVVGYLIMRLAPLNPNSHSHEVDLVGYIRKLEQALCDATHKLGITDARTLPRLTGIWVPQLVQTGDFSFQKMTSIGVGVANGITRHGFAFNYDLDFSPYLSCLIPCGLKGKGLITLKDACRARNMPAPKKSDVKKALTEAIGHVFSLQILD